MTWKNFKLFGKTKEQSLNSKSEISEFEQIKVFKSLPKEQWKPAYNELNNIIGENLKKYGFKKKGRKHYRLTNDLLEVIDIDNRGSWTGAKDDIEIRIGLVPYCWEGLTNEYHLIGSKKIEEIDETIRKHFRISEEYLILADYLSEKLIANALPFFEKYNSTKKITSQPYVFPFYSKCGGNDISKSQFLILFSELKQHEASKAIEILENEIELHKRLENVEIVTQWGKLKELINKKKWTEIDKILAENERKELNKLKIKPVANTL
ncbi:DUF4304 domain-containing protein [Confluentibacter lentus]|uniref:DUF4304 domain-containing protein n=1 Tax=Confluentibacter lentus TaxID=1699412 RepID=UPI000C28E368|nr:DUF4304 domain-containing protein [Confluentibacter lentus]